MSLCTSAAFALCTALSAVTMHGDVQASDTTDYPGPGAGPKSVEFSVKLAACPTVLSELSDSTGMVWALCTTMIGRSPEVLLLDPATGETVDQLPIAKGSLLGGVYAYLDDADRLVLVDGTQHLLKVAASPDHHIYVDDSIDLSAFVGGSSVVALTPGATGIWVATEDGRVGVVGDGGEVRSVTLGEGERIDNSISSSSAGVAVATSKALYFLEDVGGGPEVVWSQLYDAGSARKPGQLSWGTGATPTIFNDDRWVTITDNADGQIHLLVYDTADGSLVCEQPVLGNPGGTENSAIGSGTSVIVASTYGYPYPAEPAGAGPSSPLFAPFTGGIERYEVDPATGCSLAWSSPVASAAVPRLSTADGLVYTVERRGLAFDAVTLNGATGEVTSRQRIADTPAQDTLQMAGTITRDGVWWQGAVSGVFRIK
ncbi:hypothetical protein [Corynebacterium capitovis]|uniref:hypothetical protein n=1 Tax=Corynebacterium capitovis TaxID=131081 RepID=UPI00039A6E34|nr:hypothetical protein [Corynebacterium capitovis]